MEHEIAAAVNALGCLDGDSYEKEPDCLETVKDLIRYLRRDTDTSTCKVRRQLTSLNVIENDLIPILRTYRNDADLFEATLRLVINLTQPPDEKQNIEEDAKALTSQCSTTTRFLLIDDLKRTKHAFANLDFFVGLCEKLKSLVGLDWEQRQEEERLLVERILILIRNILLIQPPIEDSAEATPCNMTVHDKIVCVMHKSHMCSLLLEMARADSQREFHVFVLEIVGLLLRQYPPEILVTIGIDRSRSEQQELARIFASEFSTKQEQRRRCSGRSFAGSYTLYGLKALNESKHVVSPRMVIKSDDFSFDTRKKPKRTPKNRAPVMQSAADPVSFVPGVSGGRAKREVHTILRDFCDSFINDGYNNFMHSIQFAIERRSAVADGGTRYHFWILSRYLTAYVRCCAEETGSNLQWKMVNETVSLHCLHEAQTQLAECLDIVGMEKKNGRQWGRRAHVILKAYGEMLRMLHAMENSNDKDAIDFAMELKKTLCYVMEYREMLIDLFKKYTPVVFTRAYLKDLVEIAHVYLEMLETHCFAFGDEMKVQKKHKKRRRGKGKVQPHELRGPEGLTDEEKRTMLEEAWQLLNDGVSTLLSDVDKDPSILPTDVVAFDAAEEHGIDEKVVAQVRIQNALKFKDIPKAIALLRLSRAIWPEEAPTFGHTESCLPEDEYLLLRSIYLAELPTIPGENDNLKSAGDNERECGGLATDNVGADVAELIAHGGSDDDSDCSDENDEYVTSEVQFSFNQYLQRFTHPDVLRWYMVLVDDFPTNTAQLNQYVIKMLRRIAFGLKVAPVCFHARLFRSLQKLKMSLPAFDHLPQAEELRTFALELLDEIPRMACKSNMLVVEMLFWKGLKEAYEIEYGYGNFATQQNATKKKGQKKKRPDDDEGDAKSVSSITMEDGPAPSSPQKKAKRRRAKRGTSQREEPGKDGDSNRKSKSTTRKRKKALTETVNKRSVMPEATQNVELGTGDTEDADYAAYRENGGLQLDEMDEDIPGETIQHDDLESSPGRFTVVKRRKVVAAILSDDEDG